MRWKIASLRSSFHQPLFCRCAYILTVPLEGGRVMKDSDGAAVNALTGA